MAWSQREWARAVPDGASRSSGRRAPEGDDLWMRHAIFFPNGFCFGYGDKSGDGWGATKWVRSAPSPGMFR